MIAAASQFQPPGMAVTFSDPVWVDEPPIVRVWFLFPDGTTQSRHVTVYPADQAAGVIHLGTLPDLPPGWKWQVSPLQPGNTVTCVAVENENPVKPA